MYRQGEISPETLIILDSAVNLFSYWDSKISDSVVWPMTKRTLKKYSGFFKFDVKKFRNILKEISQNT
jgi:hypothetical protein